MRYFRLTHIAAEYAQEWENEKPAIVVLEVPPFIEDALVFGNVVPLQPCHGSCEDGPLPDYPLTIPIVSVVSQRLLPIFVEDRSDTVQVFPLVLRRERTGEPVPGFFVANVVETIDCVDRDASKGGIYTKESYPNWTKNPEKLGRFKVFDGLVLSRAAMNGHAIFRVAGWPLAIVVTEAFVRAAEEAGLTGCQFREMQTTL
ncbi:MAG TPA: hypothetical protein PLC98_23445 [Anaerolineales bacterium]|nr:hypothetical protein [Anaerolineales bacterium]